MKNLKKTTKQDFITYLAVILAFIAITVMGDAGMLSRSLKGQLVPICAYVVMAVSLNLTVGIMGELSLGHAGFMSVGAFSGVLVSQYLLYAFPVLFVVVTVYSLINMGLAAVSTGGDPLFLGVEPLLFGLFTMGADQLFIFLKQVLLSIFRDAKAK